MKLLVDALVPPVLDEVVCPQNGRHAPIGGALEYADTPVHVLNNHSHVIFIALPVPYCEDVTNLVTPPAICFPLNSKISPVWHRWQKSCSRMNSF